MVNDMSAGFTLIIGRRDCTGPYESFGFPPGCPNLEQEDLMALICIQQTQSYERKYKLYSGLPDGVKRYVIDNPKIFGKII